MRYRCLSCGGPLEITPNVTLVECRYCGSKSQRQPGTRDHGKPAAHGKWWGIGAAALSVATLAFVLLTGGEREAPEPTERPRPAPAARAETPAPAPVAQPPRSPPKRAAAPAEPPAAVPESTARRVDPSEILGKNDAKKVLEPALLACMKKEGVHYLITRLGQGYDVKSTGPLAPLVFVDSSWVDYREVDDFTDTVLGQCILGAAAQVTTRAQKGNYIYFGVRNPQVADPLEGASERLPHVAVEAALQALDGEARECMRRFPDTAPFGDSVTLEIEFRGIDGVVRKSRIFYQDPESPYSRCVIETYARAISPRFRSLTGKTTHTLTP